MKAKFLELEVKAKLFKSLQEGDQQSIDYVINEMDRLESIIKNYEIVLKTCSDHLESKSFKEPTPLFHL